MLLRRRDIGGGLIIRPPRRAGRIRHAERTLRTGVAVAARDAAGVDDRVVPLRRAHRQRGGHHRRHRCRQQHHPRHCQPVGRIGHVLKRRSSPSRSASWRSRPPRWRSRRRCGCTRRKTTLRGETVAGRCGRPDPLGRKSYPLRHHGNGGGDTRRGCGRRTHLRHRQRRRRRETARGVGGRGVAAARHLDARAITVALFGLVPRFTPVAWGVLVAFIALYLLGSIAGLPHWLINLQPFTHAQRTPGQPFDAAPVIWLLLIDVVLLAVGLLAFRRRDLR